MNRYQGKVVCGGSVSGTAYVFCKKTSQTAAERVTDAAEELRRMDDAVARAKEKFDALAANASTDAAREILEIHSMMLEDEDLLDSLHGGIGDGMSAESAVGQTEEVFSQMFRDTGDDYMIARIDDIRDVCGTLLSLLSAGEDTAQLRVPSILVTAELLPGDLLQLERKNLLGVIMGSGTVYSHVSILLREMGIPALICDGAEAIRTGMPLLLDADEGTVVSEPDMEASEAFLRKAISGIKKASPFTDQVYVNIGKIEEVTDDLMEHCGGVGLFRTEFLYVERSSLPDEEEQTAIYSELLRRAKGKPVTVRTFDVGSDKMAAGMPLEKEENPSLGMRGFRVYARYPDALKTQLRALLRASVEGELRIMVPMVNSAQEIADWKNAVILAARELENEGIPYQIPPQGAMIETPAAALVSDEIAKEADFLSVGTNDLTQYTYAVDRQNGKLDAYCDEKFRAVLKLIELTAENAHKNGITVGICGEMASMPEWADAWKEMGIDYLSVSPFLVRR